MSVLGVTAAGQRAALMLMTDSGQLRRLDPVGDAVPDPVTGVITPTHTVIYDGPGRVKAMARQGDGTVTAGDARDSQALYQLSVPLAAADAQPGDVWVTAKSANPMLVSTVLRVVDVEVGSQVTAQRMVCELVERRPA